MTATMCNAPSEADSYERASAFLSNWFQASLLVPPTSTAAAAAAREPQHRPNRRRTLPVPDTSRTLSRRNTWIASDGNINSLVNSLHHVHEQHQTHRLSHQTSRRSTNQSPLSVDEVFHDESVSSGGGSGNGAFPPLPFRKQPRQSQHQQSTVPSSSSNPSNRSRSTPRSSSHHRSNGERRRQRGQSCDDPERKSGSSKVKNHHESKHRNKRSDKQASNGAQSNRSSSHSKRSPVAEKKILSKEVAVTFNDTVQVVDIPTTPENERTTMRVVSNEEKKSSSESSSTRPRKSKSSSRKKNSKSQSSDNTTAAEGKSSSTSKSATTKHTTSSTQPSTQRPLDRLSELDGPMYDLGDTFRHPKHQIIESDPTKALNLVSQLHIHDFAWILRSTREWTYAIVADFPKKGGEDASIRLVIDKAGNTKTLKRKHWVKCIRMVDQKI